MDAQKLNGDKVIFWLDKTAKTISNLPQVTDISKNQRAQDLVRRYDELIERAKELGIWNVYCTARNCSNLHNGFDLLA